MRRCALFAFAVLAVGLMLAPGALASTGVRHVAPMGTRHAVAAGVRFAPLGTDPTYAISGHVYYFNKAPVAGAEVDWGWWTSNTGYRWGGTNLEDHPDGTASDGAFTFSAVLGGHQSDSLGADDLHVWYFPQTPGLEEMAAFTLDFATNNNASSYSYDLQPAQVNVTTTKAPVSTIEVRAGNSVFGYARADVHLTAGAGTASVLPMANFNDVVGYCYYELSPKVDNSIAQVEQSFADVNIGAGTTAADTVNLDWSKAQYAYLAGPICDHSGKSGTTVKMVLRGWPTGERPQFVGYFGEAVHDYGVGAPKSPGAASTFTVPLKVSVAPGIYEIDTDRADNPASLIGMWDYFQVCTFKSTPSVIHHGKAVRLSGVVPATGKVTVYSTTHKVTAQPKTLTAKGWTKMKTTFKVSAKGKFATGLLHPKRTTWYVVKYSGFAFPAFTSVIKVTVH
jgi:hypothetical protein